VNSNSSNSDNIAISEEANNNEYLSIKDTKQIFFDKKSKIFILQKNIPVRLVHVGVHKNGNAGDTLLFPAIRALLQKYLAPIEFTLVNVHDVVTQELIDLINNHDGIIIGGGGLFLKDTNSNQISGWQWACPLDLLEKIRVPIVVFAVGYNRFRGQDDFDDLFKYNIELLVNKSAFFSLRNNGSIEAIKQYIDPSLHNKIFLQPCPTTLLSKFYPYEIPKNKYRNILALNIPFDRSNLRYCNQEESIFKNLAEIIKRIESEGWQVILYNNLNCDAEAAIWLRKYGKLPLQLNLQNMPPSKVIYWYNQASAVIGGRGHAQMIPFGLNIPIFSLISHDKMGWFLDDIKHPEWGEEIRSPELEDKIIHYFQSVKENEMKKQLTESQDLLWLQTINNIKKLDNFFMINNT